MKVVAGMATFARRDRVQAIASMQCQVDRLHLYDNAVEPFDLTDLGKFHGLKCFDKPVYYFSCDDDIIYPPDYVAKMIKWIEHFDGNSIVTSHGRKLKGPGRHYYNDHQQFNCKSFVNGVHRIDVAGTGVTAFRTDKFNPVEVLSSSDRRMADLVFSLEAARAGFPIHVVPHRSGYFKTLNVPQHLTCFGMESKNPVRQGELADQIYELNYGNSTAEK